VAEARAELAVAGGALGGSADDLVLLTMKMRLSGADSLASLLAAIAGAGKYVELDLSRCTMSGTGFETSNTNSAGKDWVVSLTLPNGARSIGAAAADGEPAFLGFTSLRTAGSSGITTIGPAAFQGCASLAALNLPAAASIGFISFYNAGARVPTITLPRAAPALQGDDSGDSFTKTVTIKRPANSTGYDVGWQKLFKYQFGLENRGAAITLRFQDL
jgi:hypothetical protein